MYIQPRDSATELQYFASLLDCLLLQESTAVNLITPTRSTHSLQVDAEGFKASPITTSYVVNIPEEVKTVHEMAVFIFRVNIEIWTLTRINPSVTV